MTRNFSIQFWRQFFSNFPNLIHNFRSFLNSPLIRRRKKPSLDSTSENSTKTENQTENDMTKNLQDSDSEDEMDNASSKDSGFTNLESFQKKILRQKLKKLNKDNTTGPYPSPPPAPQRVPHPPRKNLQHSTGLLQPSTPLLPRRALRKGLGHPGATPTSTPNPTPNTKRRGLNALIQQYQQQQSQVNIVHNGQNSYILKRIWILKSIWNYNSASTRMNWSKKSISIKNIASISNNFWPPTIIRIFWISIRKFLIYFGKLSSQKIVKLSRIKKKYLKKFV